MESFFNWYYTSIGVSTVLALTIIVYIQDQLGWKFGFGVPVILMIISTLIFLAGASLYVKVKPSKSLFTGFVQVLVVAFKNRKLSLPQSNSDQYCHSHDSNFLIPTDNLRYSLLLQCLTLLICDSHLRILLLALGTSLIVLDYNFPVN